MLTWFAQIIRSFFFWIDYNLFGFIETLYNLLIDLSRTTILTQGDIKEFADRVQLLLGVFMLFKVAFSIITYVINPDEMTDKSKGFAKMGQNIIISLILLVVTPYIFGMAYDLQTMVLEDNTIANLIFGYDEDGSFIDTGGQQLSFSVMLPFFRPNTGLPYLASCKTLYQSGSNGTEFNQECYNAMKSAVEDDKNQVLDERIIGNYTTGVKNKNFGLTFRSEVVTFLTNDNQFLFDYKIILSTVAAVVVILIMLTYAMDVALRSVKLAFLQLISPIPIISYIDPKQGKDGMFKKWYSMCFSTYISLFVRLLALYFGFYLINIVTSRGFTDVLTGETVEAGWFDTGMWINLFMIIGILMFIKQLPKILEGFGIKLDGGGKFTLNPFKKFENEAFGGKQILGAGAALGAGALSGATNIVTKLPNTLNKLGDAMQNSFNKENWVKTNGRASFGSVLRGLGRTAGRFSGALLSSAPSAIAGTSSGIFRGMRKTMKGEKPGKIFTDSYGEAMFAKLNREDVIRKAGLEEKGIVDRAKFAMGSLGADVARWTGTLTKGQQEYLKADEYDKKIAGLQEENAEYKYQQDQMKKDRFEDFESIQGIGKNIDSLLESDKRVKAAKAAWNNAPSQGKSNEEIEALRQEYKRVKGEVLSEQARVASSEISHQVGLYNQIYGKIEGKLTEEQKKKFKKLDTNYSIDISYKDDVNGNYVSVGNNTYEIKKGAGGEIYYEDELGNYHLSEFWASEGAKRVNRIETVNSGVNIMGDNDEYITSEKISFETSDEYTSISDSIKANERKIEEIKTSENYKAVKNPTSVAKLQNDNQWSKETQKPAYKPSASSTFGTPQRGMYNLPMGNGSHTVSNIAGGTPPPGGGTPPSPPGGSAGTP